MLGLAQRGGKVLAKAVFYVNTGKVLNFVLDKVNADGSTLIMGENNVYSAVERYMSHKTSKHSEQYVDDTVHTNTLEGFWLLLKRAWYGQHHKYKVAFLPLYLAEACWKYNNRKEEHPFDFFIQGCSA